MWVRSLGEEDSPAVRSGTPLHYSCLENSMDRGAWRATVHGVPKMTEWLSAHMHTHPQTTPHPPPEQHPSADAFADRLALQLVSKPSVWSSWAPGPLGLAWLAWVCVLLIHYCQGLPWWLSCKESACNAGNARDVGSTPGAGRSPGERAWQPTPVFLPGESHGQRSLAGCSPRGHKESDVTEVTEHTCRHTTVRLSLLFCCQPDNS